MQTKHIKNKLETNNNLLHQKKKLLIIIKPERNIQQEIINNFKLGHKPSQKQNI